MRIDWKAIRQWLLIIAFGILLYWGLNHMDMIAGGIGSFLGMVTPFLFGAAVAFILRRPLARIESLILRLSRVKGFGFLKKISRMLGILLTFLLFIAVLILVLFLVIPEFVRAVSILISSLEQFIRRLQNNTENWDFLSQQVIDWINSLQIDWTALGNEVRNWLISGAGTVLGGTVGAVSAVFSGVVNTFMALVFSIYLLSQKEKLGRQFTRLFYAILPDKQAKGLLDILSMAGDTFSNFFSGQITEAVILGSMFFVCMNIFRFPYALVISVMIAVLALIPIFGAFIGCATGAFLIVMVDPMKAVWFVIMFLIIQQIEGNLIYPRVVGSSVGLPSIWVLVAVTVGGSAMGIIGMVLFIPLFSVFYNLLRIWTGRRLAVKEARKKAAGYTDDQQEPQEREAKGEQ